MAQGALRELLDRLRGLGLGDDDCRQMMLMLSFLVQLQRGADTSRYKKDVDEVFAMLQLEDSFIYQAAKERYLDEGERLGLDKGKRLGLDEGKRLALLTVLSGKGVGLTEEDRVHILNCQDEGLVTRWLNRAGQVSSAAELFQGD